MNLPKFSFIGPNINITPLAHGIYILYDKDSVIYIGRASGDGVTIRSRLKNHYSGEEGPGTQAASYFSFQGCPDPEDKEKELLTAYQLQHGALPRCNERIG